MKNVYKRFIKQHNQEDVNNYEDNKKRIFWSIMYHYDDFLSTKKKYRRIPY